MYVAWLTVHPKRQVRFSRLRLWPCTRHTYLSYLREQLWDSAKCGRCLSRFVTFLYIPKYSHNYSKRSIEQWSAYKKLCRYVHILSAKHVPGAQLANIVAMETLSHLRSRFLSDANQHSSCRGHWIQNTPASWNVPMYHHEKMQKHGSNMIYHHEKMQKHGSK